MARVKRFIYNSDFMTIAHVGREQISVTIPAGETINGSYNGSLSFPLDIPARSFARVRLRYVGDYRSLDIACSGMFYAQSFKNGKEIDYLVDLSFSEKRLKVDYAVINATDQTTVLADALTVTLTIDFLQQPNT